MEKNKKDLMILIVIIFIGINYVIYTYFITSQLDNIKTQKNKYLAQKQKLNDIKLKKQSIDKKKKDLEKLKKETADFDNVVPTEINTPQLIYDFYTGCKLFGIVGQNLTFQLLDNNTDPNKSPNTNSSANNNTNTNNTNSTDNKSKQPSGKFYTLTVNLKVLGDKENVENFIKNLGVITKRKLNVKNITISSSENNNTSKETSNGVDIQSDTKAQSQPSTNKLSSSYTKKNFYIDNHRVTVLRNASDKNYMSINFIDKKLYADDLVNEATQQDIGKNNSISSIPNSNNSNIGSVPSKQTSDQIPTNQLSAEIIFYQYIQGDGNNQIKVPDNYEFYDSQKEGFNSISDMFK
ncbi:hypothetical protein [Clostridium sp. DJ247]|uniref:hypothetical protein n=1 Tax=Clostridium sp. DJ247 TaxID=2726188 RepID=UPI00162599CF|nr:hypothetical protein [Clostridium sp. DJ247]MBC2579951.1 hypothetical protein [Clostridium sp. DJ247]